MPKDIKVQSSGDKIQERVSQDIDDSTHSQPLDIIEQSTVWATRSGQKLRII